MLCFHNAAISLETDIALILPVSKRRVLSTRSQIAETLPHLSSSLKLCFKEGHYHVFTPKRFNNPIRSHSSTSVGAGQSMPFSLESNSPSDLNTDSILYLTYLRSATGQEFSLPALSCIAALSFLGPFLLMLQTSPGLRQTLSEKPRAQNPAE